VDLRGRFVAPGFIDGHLHLLGGSLSLEQLRLDDAFTFAASPSASRTGRRPTRTPTG
jgi:predicted amidohydrolase YtcJ